MKTNTIVKKLDNLGLELCGQDPSCEHMWWVRKGIQRHNSMWFWTIDDIAFWLKDGAKFVPGTDFVR